MRRFLPAAVLAALPLCVCTSVFAGVLDPTPPTLGPTTFDLMGGTVTLTPGTPIAQIDATDPSNPETNYWIIPTSKATFTDANGTVQLSPTQKTIGGQPITYFTNAQGTIAINLTQIYNSDAILGYSVQLDNTTGSPLTFNNPAKTAAFPAIAGPTLYKGTVGITLTDDDGGGATLSPLASQSIYQASIDGTAVLNLASTPFSVVDGDTETESFNSGFLGGGPALPDGHNLAIKLAFTLSANDSVGITSNFVVLPPTGGGVPEPTSLALLGLGAVGLLKRRR
jgi:hypothetical protein